MALHHGKDGVVKSGANAIASVTAWKFTGKIDLVESAVMGATNKTYLEGLTDFDGTVDCYLDPTDATGQETLTVGASVTLTLYPQGVSATANWVISAIITQLDAQASMTEVVKRSFTWKATAAPAWTA
ncbi:MAG TPA: hypothetical protein VFB13_17855 [Reyranella sp.]|nr:hypothetical protein [Reyranella sp.]